MKAVALVPPPGAVWATANPANGDVVVEPLVICTPEALKKSMPPRVAPASGKYGGGGVARAVPVVATRAPPARASVPTPVSALRRVAFIFVLFWSMDLTVVMGMTLSFGMTQGLRGR